MKRFRRLFHLCQNCRHRKIRHASESCHCADCELKCKEFVA